MVISEDWFFWSHRRALAVAASRNGYDVVLATPVREHGDRIRALGIGLRPLTRLDRASRRLSSEWAAFRELVELYKRERPDLVHHVTIKVVLYGSVAARVVGVPRVVNGIYGLGHVFESRGLAAGTVRLLVRLAYRIAFGVLGSRNHVTFENSEDRDRFVRMGLVRKDRTTVIRGMGYDPTLFTLQPEPEGIPIVMMAGRLLWSKGVGELVLAARELRRRGVTFRLVLVGAPDTANPATVPEAVLESWVDEGIVEWWGRRSDMPAVLREAAVVALPSAYGEGLPKILIEAAGVGRALVATDIPGCREIARHEVTGLLVPVGDAQALTEALHRLVADPDLRRRLGRQGHLLAREAFSDDVVNRDTLAVYDALFRP